MLVVLFNFTDRCGALEDAGKDEAGRSGWDQLQDVAVVAIMTGSKKKGVTKQQQPNNIKGRVGPLWPGVAADSALDDRQKLQGVSDSFPAVEV